MHAGKSYNLWEFLFWTRRSIFWLLLMGLVPTALYELLHFTWLAVPFTIIGLLGTATAFIITFRNQETYNRTWEARQIWGATMSASRGWALMCRDFLHNPAETKKLVYRHFAWLTALRYQLRKQRVWENASKAYNQEYRKYFVVPEAQTPLAQELEKYISPEEISVVSTSANKATQILGLQSAALKKLREDGSLEEFRFLDMHNALTEFSSHQGKSERIKNFPYPRQYATINGFFVKLFCFLLPFGLLEEFDKLNETVTGFARGNMVWLVIPFSVLISWVFTSLEQVGESTENPYEGSSNDIPISQMSRAVEIDIREMLGETELPKAFKTQNDIIL